MQWQDFTSRARTAGFDARLLLQEELQKAVLASMSIGGCFDNVVFQGGTALRLFFSNPRYSEDIDLCTMPDGDMVDLAGPMSRAGTFCLDHFPFLSGVSARVQKDGADIKRYILATESDVPAQRLKLHIELASVPSWKNSPRILDFPPVRPVIRVEEPAEILADKVCAFALRPYLKGRDIWDLRFLLSERGISTDLELVRKKMNDYSRSKPEFVSGLSRALGELESNGASVLDNEMVRFLPTRVLESYRPSYPEILSTVAGEIRRTLERLGEKRR